ncbi:MAG: hypothetical protein AAES65_00470 [Candidatus Thiodiazotropha sp. (ex. Lucinoma kazani)]
MLTSMLNKSVIRMVDSKIHPHYRAIGAGYFLPESVGSWAFKGLKIGFFLPIGATSPYIPMARHINSHKIRPDSG